MSFALDIIADSHFEDGVEEINDAFMEFLKGEGQQEVKSAFIMWDMYSRGLPCSNLGGNQTANEKYWENNKALLLAKFIDSYTFLSVSISSLPETVPRHEKLCFSII